mgnify:FL=1
MASELFSKIHPDTAGTLQHWLPRVVNMLLLAGIVWLGYQLVLKFLPHDDQNTPPVTTTAPAPEKIAEPGIAPDRIADWHLFGESAALLETDSASDIPTQAPETKLQLSLKGVVASSDTTQGYAIIQKPDKEEKHFKVDDSVFGLASLEEIYVDRVILKRNGRYETLRLPIEFMSSDLAL